MCRRCYTSRQDGLAFFLLLQLELDIHRPVHLFRNLVDVSEGDVVFLEPDVHALLKWS